MFNSQEIKPRLKCVRPLWDSNPRPCADPENFLRVGWGGEGVQIPRSGLTENFNMAKNNNLAIPREGGGVSGPPDPPPLDPPMHDPQIFED